MFKIAEFRAAEIALNKQLAAFEELKKNPELQREFEFDTALDKFLATHSLNRSKLQAFLTMQGFPPRVMPAAKPSTKAAKTTKAAKPAAKAKAQAQAKAPAKPDERRTATGRRPPNLVGKVYKNPHNGESITVKRVDHGVLQKWITQHGQETVDTWLQAA